MSNNLSKLANLREHQELVDPDQHQLPLALFFPDNINGEDQAVGGVTTDSGYDSYDDRAPAHDAGNHLQDFVVTGFRGAERAPVGEDEVDGEITPSTLARNLRAAFQCYTYDKWVASSAYNAMLEADFPLEYQTISYDGVVYQIPQWWSPTFWKTIVSWISSDISIGWVNTIRHLPPQPNTRKGEAMNVRILFAKAIYELVVVHNVGPLRRLLKTPSLVDSNFTANPFFSEFHAMNEVREPEDVSFIADYRMDDPRTPPPVFDKIIDIGFCNHWRRTRPVQDAFNAEKVAGNHTSAPQDVVAGAGPKLETAHEMPAGVSSDVMQGAGAAEAGFGLAATRSKGDAAVYMIPSGGITAEEGLGQTGNNMSIATLAGQKIFSDIVNIPMGTTQGTVLREYEVNPWNADILNPYAKEWADLHTRFYGTFKMHFTFITTATVIGLVKVYYVPYMYKDIPRTQSALDAMPTWFEMSVNVTGEGVIYLNCTTAETKLNGVFRDSEQTAFGAVVVLAASDFYNSFAEASAFQVQMRMSNSLGEDAFYDSPASLRMPAAIHGGSGNLNLPSIGGAHIHTDGQKLDGIDWSKAFDAIKAHKTVPFSLRKGGYLSAFPLPEEVGKPVHYTTGDDILYGVDDTYTLLEFISVGFNLQLNYDSGVWTKGTDLISVQERVASLEGIEYQGISVTPDNHTFCSYVDGGTGGVIAYTDKSPNSNFLRMVENPVLVQDSEGQISISHLSGLEVGPAVWETEENDDFTNPYKRYGYGHLVKLSGVAICAATQEAEKDDIPSGYYSVRIAADKDIVPTVASGLIGNSIVMTSDQISAMLIYYVVAKGNDKISIVTTLADETGARVCSILRNSSGMFMSSIGIQLYNSCNYQIGSLFQTHKITFEKWPVLDVARANAFTNRQAAPGFNPIFTGVLPGVLCDDDLVKDLSVKSYKRLFERRRQAASHFHAAAAAEGMEALDAIEGAEEASETAPSFDWGDNSEMNFGEQSRPAGVFEARDNSVMSQTNANNINRANQNELQMANDVRRVQMQTASNQRVAAMNNEALASRQAAQLEANLTTTRMNNEASAARQNAQIESNRFMSQAQLDSQNQTAKQIASYQTKQAVGTGVATGLSSMFGILGQLAGSFINKGTQEDVAKIQARQRNEATFQSLQAGLATNRAVAPIQGA